MSGSRAKAIKKEVIARDGALPWTRYTRDGRNGGTMNLGLGGIFRAAKKHWSARWRYA